MNESLKPLAFCPELVDIYSQRKLRAESGKEFELGACSTVNNLVTLMNLFSQVKPNRTLEIGMAFGGSCLLFAALFRQNNVKATKQHIAIDPFQTSHWEQLGIKAVQRAGLADYVSVQEELSSIELPKLVAQQEQFDLVYVDGSHLFEDVFVDAYFTAKLLAIRGVVVFDDCRDPNVSKVIRFLRRNMQRSLEELDLSSYRADRGKTLKYRVARKLGQTQIVAFRRIGEGSRPWNALLRDF
jgi:predicted O-methyltransferase YrrM